MPVLTGYKHSGKKKKGREEREGKGRERKREKKEKRGIKQERKLN